MRTFVISDIHGHYDTFIKLLDLIEFKPDDLLYIDGDVIDRGKDGIRLIKYIMQQPNMEMFLGNHEMMMLKAIEYQRDLESGKIDPKAEDDHLTPYELWTHPANGGEDTFRDFYSLSRSEQDEIEAYLKGLRLIKRIEVAGVKYHISHSYSINRRFGKELFLIGSLGIEQSEIIRLMGELLVHIPLWVDEHFVRVE